jgi:hypothetical protein
MSKYQKLAPADRQVLASVFAPERDELRGQRWGVEFGRKRPFDQGGIRDRGSVRPEHAVSRRHGTSNVAGLGRSGDADFGVPDSNFGGRHLDARISRPAYTPDQRLHSHNPGAGLSGGRPEWASVGRVRANAGDEYVWDPKGNHNYYYPAARGPFR